MRTREAGDRTDDAGSPPRAPADPRPAPTPTRRGGAPWAVELIRLAVVLSFTAAGFAVGPPVDALLGPDVAPVDLTTTRLIASVLGALVGYVAGGVLGRGFLSGVDAAEARLRRIDAAVLVSAVLGAAVAGLLAALLLTPVLVLPYKAVTVPAAMTVAAIAMYVGGRLGAARGGDLLRFLGARGRIEVTSPTRGGITKLVDTSALIDGRILEVARGGFLEGTVVIPRFILEELQRLADTEEPRRRRAGRRGLEALQRLQHEQVVGVEVTDDDVAQFADVDAKLAALARERRAALLTVDANLSRVAEISGVRVLNLHALAEALRPPVLPGDRIEIRINKPGREPGQGVGYLPDGTMVVVERARPHVGEQVTAEVASLLQNRNGRMVFATLQDQ
ncbi:MAG: TRAM domain-containing protein [Actinomycetota bacterium]|nr:TRAM domain-containing protein [Actinomycetota bacterium]